MRVGLAPSESQTMQFRPNVGSLSGQALSHLGKVQTYSGFECIVVVSQPKHTHGSCMADP